MESVTNRKRNIQVLIDDRDETLEGNVFVEFISASGLSKTVSDVLVHTESVSHTLADDDLKSIVNQVKALFVQQSVNPDDYDDGDTILFNTVIENDVYIVIYSKPQDELYTVDETINQLAERMNKLDVEQLIELADTMGVTLDYQGDSLFKITIQ